MPLTANFPPIEPVPDHRPDAAVRGVVSALSDPEIYFQPSMVQYAMYDMAGFVIDVFAPSALNKAPAFPWFYKKVFHYVDLED